MKKILTSFWKTKFPTKVRRKICILIVYIIDQLSVRQCIRGLTRLRSLLVSRQTSKTGLICLLGYKMVAKFTKGKCEADQSLLSLYIYFFSRVHNFKGKQTCHIAATESKKLLFYFLIAMNM